MRAASSPPAGAPAHNLLDTAAGMLLPLEAPSANPTAHDLEEAMLMFVRRWLIRTGLFRMACRADGGALDACCPGLQGGGGGQQPGRAAGGGGGECRDGGAALALPGGQAVDVLFEHVLTRNHIGHNTA